MVARGALLLSLFLAAACDETDGCPDGPQYIVEEGGRVAFYDGCDVRNEVRDNGAFEPDFVDTFSVISVPSKLLPTVEDPTTVSLCSPDWGVRIEFHDRQCTIDPSPYNPILTVREDGACIVHVESGQPGISGTVQLRWGAGSLEAWAGFHADIYFSTEDGGTENLGYGRGATPVDLEDATIEDPLVGERCPCTDPDVCEPPEGF